MSTRGMHGSWSCESGHSDDSVSTRHTSRWPPSSQTYWLARDMLMSTSRHELDPLDDNNDPQPPVRVSTRHTYSQKEKPAEAGSPSNRQPQWGSAGFHIEQLTDQFPNLRFLRVGQHAGLQLHRKAVGILGNAPGVALPRKNLLDAAL